jgi:alkaline phosphatase
MGKSTGLVATSDITHATPAALGANAHNRKLILPRNILPKSRPCRK